MTNFELKEGLRMGEAMIEQKIFTVTKLPPLGDGLGSISVVDRLTDDVDRLAQEHLDIAEVEINNPNNMVELTDPNTDGCPDGRGCNQYINSGAQRVVRPKVFGGGQTMAMAGLVGTGKAKGGNLKDAFSGALDLLSEKTQDFGAHGSDHKKDGESGCGAIDKGIDNWETALMPEVKTKIINTISALAGEQGDKMVTTINEVYENIEATVPGFDRQTYSGEKVVLGAIKRGKIVAELGGEHREIAVVINVDVDGKTFDQSKIRELTDDQAQVFSVDVPRMRELANNLFDSAENRQKAFIAMFIYSLATATVLTKNDLPLYLISKTDNPAVEFSFN